LIKLIKNIFSNFFIKKTKSERYGGSIQTFTGRIFYPLDPRESEVVIEDIAHALSNKCRFSGHSLRYFSVAEHSVIVSLLCPQDIALWGLLHDASEAYLIDLPTPLKYLPEFAWYRKLEEKVTNVIMNRFSLPQKEPKLVKTADKTCLVTEKRDNMRVTFEWENKYKEMPIPTKLNCLLPEQAEKLFLARYHELINGKNNMTIENMLNYL
jgi:hypothetical protein